MAPSATAGIMSATDAATRSTSGLNPIAMGEQGSELRLPSSGVVRATVKVAALLDEKPDPDLQRHAYEKKPYWDIERARLANTSNVRLFLADCCAGRKPSLIHRCGTADCCTLWLPALGLRSIIRETSENL